MKLTIADCKVLLKILKIYIPIAAPLVNEDELEELEILQDKAKKEVDNDTN